MALLSPPSVEIEWMVARAAQSGHPKADAPTTNRTGRVSAAGGGGLVRAGELELPPLSRPGPKPGASANSATLAWGHLRTWEWDSAQGYPAAFAVRWRISHGEADSDRRLPGDRRRCAASRRLGGGRFRRALLRPAQ